MHAGAGVGVGPSKWVWVHTLQPTRASAYEASKQASKQAPNQLATSQPPNQLDNNFQQVSQASAVMPPSLPGALMAHALATVLGRFSYSQVCLKVSTGLFPVL